MELKKVKLNNFEFGGDKLAIIAGPCAIESRDVVFQTAEKLKEITQELDIPFVFKASYDKANRTSIESFRGPGMEKGLEILAEVKKEFDVPILTDIHTPYDAAPVGEVVDVLQIPAFLSRQTDILVEAAKTGKIVNIKKGQFLSPDQVFLSAQKVIKSGNSQVLITERGSSFGYGNLVVDMRSIYITQQEGYPVVFDATHSVQLPGGGGTCSSGDRRFVEPLSNAAVAAGAGSLFFEVHPNPDKALCDGPNMISLSDAKRIFAKNKDIFEALRK
jgi:2-dehydro-3-deoxyphosphooctonate aldolase (KDO 8-P synthase)